MINLINCFNNLKIDPQWKNFISFLFDWEQSQKIAKSKRKIIIYNIF